MRLALLQQALAWEDREANYRVFETMLAPLRQQVDLVVLPEMFTTGFTMQPERLAEPAAAMTIRWLQTQARALDAAVTGSVVVADAGKFFNRLLWVTPDGAVSSYDKRHLFRMAREHEHYTAGASTLLIEWRGFKIAPLVCYDLRFPVWSRRRPDFDYDLLVYVANWPAVRRYPWQQLLRARAIENQAYVAGVNRVGSDGNGVAYAGDSVIVDYFGQPMVELADAAGAVRATLELAPLVEFRRKFPAHLDADRFTIAP
ncbi:MAG TPA: amidohydrolase [Steroidobacteraceae bacterium]|nr:amidohydrolase [Steroidobacteraceae bacterium]HRX89152.1 amidohydrolase [Steroidobacteraceae bacterium]